MSLATVALENESVTLAAAKTDWTKFHMYNTLMGLAAGVALVLVVLLGRALYRRQEVNLEGYAIAFGVTGFILTLLGGHMTLTWPFDTYVPQANIEFGEGSLAFGVLLLAAAFYLWRTARLEAAAPGGEAEAADAPALIDRLAVVARPVSWFVAAVGLAMIAIGIAGIDYELFGAPPEEPISGEFADHPMVESIFISSLFFLIGIGAVLTPFFLRNLHKVLGAIIGVSWFVAGVFWTAFSVMNYYTHIGLIINTI